MSSLALKATLGVIAEEVRHIIGAHQCVTSVVDSADGKQALHGTSFSEKHAGGREDSEAGEDATILAILCQEKRPARMRRAEMEAHPRWRRLLGKGGSAFPLADILVVPLVAAGGDTIGCIRLSEKYGGDFTEKDEATLVRLARIASVSIEHARRCQEAEAARGEKVEFLRQLVHEIRSFLNPIVIWSQVLSTGKSDRATRARALKAIERSAKKIADLLKKV